MPISKSFIIVPFLLTGCVSFTSMEIKSANADDGVIYYLPKRNIAIAVDVDDAGLATKATIGAGPSYPDTSQPYLLRHRNGLIGKHETNIGVSNGLLTTSNATVSSSLSDLGKELGELAGTISGMGFLSATEKLPSTCSKGTHHIVIEPNSVGDTLCGLKISIVPLPVSNFLKGNERPSDTAHPGVFYRLNRPYKVAANREHPALRESAIVLIPNDSPTMFLPISRSFFADSKAEISFSDGILNGYKQTTDSEALGLVKLPAEILSSYFAAIGAVFTSFKARGDLNMAAMETAIKLELTKQKYENCIAAISTKNDDLITTLNCGQ